MLLPAGLMCSLIVISQCKEFALFAEGTSRLHILWESRAHCSQCPLDVAYPLSSAFEVKGGTQLISTSASSIIKCYKH